MKPSPDAVTFEDSDGNVWALEPDLSLVLVRAAKKRRVNLTQEGPTLF